MLINGRVEYTEQIFEVGTQAAQTCMGSRALTGESTRTCTSPQTSISCNTPGIWVAGASMCGEYIYTHGVVAVKPCSQEQPPSGIPTCSGAWL